MRKIITLTGPSCSGKTTLLSDLVANHGFNDLVSTTTRPRRANEVEGVDYYFVDNDSFKALVDSAKDKLVEHVYFSGNNYYYGVTTDELKRKLAADQPVIAIVEPTGVLSFKRVAYQLGVEFASIYVDVDLDVAINRMNDRDGDSSSIEQRLANLKEKEIHWLKQFDYDFVVDRYGDDNDDQVAQEVIDFITARESLVFNGFV